MLAKSIMSDIFVSLVVWLNARHIISSIPGNIPTCYQNSAHDFNMGNRGVIRKRKHSTDDLKKHLEKHGVRPEHIRGSFLNNSLSETMIL